jgi:hypothetical protein
MEGRVDMSVVAQPGPHRSSSPVPRQTPRAVIREALDNRKLPRRVRYEVRDGVTVIAFSAASSTVAAMAFGFLLSRVG